MTQENRAIELRQFEPRDVPAAQALSNGQGWPHRIVDWHFALSLGQGVVAEANGEVLGTALTWQWGERHATIGLVIVEPKLQGQRIGHRMMTALLDLSTGRDVLLHSTEAGRGLYERLGFAAVGEIDQNQGVLRSVPAIVAREGDRVRSFEARDFSSLVALDMRGAGMPRGELLRRLFYQGQTVVLERGGKTVGFAIVRRYGRGHAVGPVVALDADAARLLIAECCRHAEGFVRIDVHTSSGLSPWLETLGLPRVGGGTVMVRGRVPQRGPSNGGWAVVTQAIG